MAQICVIEDVQVEPVTATQDGREKGSLRVRGYLIPICVTMPAKEVNSDGPYANDPETGERIGDFSPDAWDIVGTAFELNEKIWCLPIYGFASYSYSNSKDAIADGRVLGLRLVGDDDGSTYTRIGEGHCPCRVVGLPILRWSSY